MAADLSECRVLSVQSHVARGYVGNKCAQFPLQLHTVEVDAINSVQFSNHTWYKHCKGQVLNCDQVWEVYEGLRLNGLHTKYTHLLTGYCADATFLDKITHVLADLRAVNPKLIYVCDPVLGDRGRYYVPRELTEIYAKTVAPLADVITPNQFELQELSGMEVSTEAGALSALDALHSAGCKCIVVSSTDLAPEPSKMYVYASRLTANGKPAVRCRYEIERLDANFVGSGDVFTALLLLWLHKTNGDLKLSVGKVLATLSVTLKRTLAHARQLQPTGELGPEVLELRLIHSQQAILEPDVNLLPTAVDL